MLEITEAEKLEDRPAKEKRRLVDEWHAKIAVDDYGTGYNGESVDVYKRQPLYSIALEGF